MARIKIDVSAGILEVEGDEAFLKEIYEDFKQRVHIETRPKQIGDSGENSKKERVPRSNNKTARKAKPQLKKIPETLKQVEVDTAINDFPGFYDLKTKTDKFLWVLILAKESNLLSLTNQEIVYLSDAIGEGIPSNDINKNYKANLKKGHVNRSLQDNKIRITPKGILHLKSLKNKKNKI